MFIALALCFLGNVCVGASVAQSPRAARRGSGSLDKRYRAYSDDVIMRINVVLDQNPDIRAFTSGLEERKTDNDVVYYGYESKKNRRT